MCLNITGSRNEEIFRVSFTHTRLFLPEELGLVLHASDYAKQKQEDHALQWEAKEAQDSDNHQLHANCEDLRFPESLSPKVYHNYSLPSSRNAEPPQPPPVNLPPPNDLPPVPDPHHQFTIGSMVCLDVQKGEPLYGVLQWVGTVPDFNGTIAGVELVSDCEKCAYLFNTINRSDH